MKSAMLKKIALLVVPTFLSIIVRLWFATCRVTVHGQKYKDAVLAHEHPGIAVFWHYSFLYSFYQNRKEKVAAMVSGSSDGEYISRFLEKFGVKSFRGSRNRGGVGALKGMIRVTQGGYNVAIVADGSQGPPLVVQAGCILLASKTGCPILPMLWSSNRYIRFNSWDGTSVPYPFAKIDFFYAAPLEVPPKLSSQEVEKYRVILEEQMLQLYATAWDIQGKVEH